MHPPFVISRAEAPSTVEVPTAIALPFFSSLTTTTLPVPPQSSIFLIPGLITSAPFSMNLIAPSSTTAPGNSPRASFDPRKGKKASPACTNS